MMPSYLMPITQPVDVRSFVFDWDDGVEGSLVLLLAFVMPIVLQLLLLIYIVLANLQSFSSVYRRQINEFYRRRYRNFIFRRLLSQLDAALMPRPIAGEELIGVQHAKEQAVLAIRLFHRDALKVLYPDCALDTLAAGDLYYVLDAEENELHAAGYGDVKFEVTNAFLESLLYPHRVEPRPFKNKSIL